MPGPRSLFSPSRGAWPAAPGAPGPPPPHFSQNLFGAIDSVHPVVPDTAADGGCWAGDFQPFPCCHPSFGPAGFAGCWQEGGEEYTFQRCCTPWLAPAHAFKDRALLAVEGEPVLDFVVVGAGSGGSTAAARLARRGFTVALLESGPWDAPSLYEEHPNPSSPAQGGQWFISEAEWYLGLVMRRVQTIAGRVLGGSSAVNGHVYTRTELPFDPGFVGRAYADVEEQLTLRFGDEAPNGTGAGLGGMQLCERRVVGIFQEQGVPYVRHSAHTPPVGIGPVQRVAGCAGQAGPSSAYRCAIAIHNSSGAGRLRVFPESHVDRVLVSAGRATGVAVVGGGSLHVRHEVLLAAGALRTPLILARSGVGPLADLSRLSVPPVADSPRLGFGLQDHLYLPLKIDTGLPCATSAGARPLRDLFAFYDGLPARKSGSPWRNGHLQIELQLSPSCRRSQHSTSAATAAATLQYKAYLILLHSQTPGRVTARSADPRVPEAVLFDPFAGEAADVWALLRHARSLYRVLSAGLALVGSGASFEPPYADLFDDVAAGRYAAQSLGFWMHPTGTARLGDVVDSSLAVRGLGGVRVADGSVLPASAAGHPDAAIRAVGHIAAEFAAAGAAKRRPP